jgi:hypothetical protein
MEFLLWRPPSEIYCTDAGSTSCSHVDKASYHREEMPVVLEETMFAALTMNGT